jgi:hypothetical protein
MVRLLTLVLFEPTPIETHSQRKGKFPNPPGQLIETVPVDVMVEPEIRSTLPNRTFVALTAHCACAGDVISAAASAAIQKTIDRKRAIDVTTISIDVAAPLRGYGILSAGETAPIACAIKIVEWNF